jgi:hypothetical protein
MSSSTISKAVKAVQGNAARRPCLQCGGLGLDLAMRVK